MTRVEGAQGQAFFRYENLSAILPELGEVYKYPALVPAMTWKDSIPPLVPENITVSIVQGVSSIRWNEPVAAGDNEKPFRYIVYRSSAKSIDTRRAENILTVLPASQLFYQDETSNAKDYFYTVTAIDRTGNESVTTGKSSSDVLTMFSRYDKSKAQITLSQDVPNPTNGKTYISFELPRRMFVTLFLKFSTSQQETVIVKQTKDAGIHIVAIDTKKIPSGSIEYRLQADETSMTRIMEKK